MKRLFTFVLFTNFVVGLFALNSIKGIVVDLETGEPVLGCSVLLQGTTMGNITNEDGTFEIKNVPGGTYNLIVSLLSYEKHMQKVVVAKTGELSVDIKLKPLSNTISDVVVTAQRRTDSELSMISANRQSLTIVSGITSQQIQRSQDKDASEVIRRIPGVSIRDGKFVIVRGLTERYNSVWLNGSSTPSSESDVRAFSFDVIPSGQIDNILIYKSPAPELPADFAGAMINVKTKSLIDRNSITVSASAGYNQLSTGKTFYTSKGSSTDWLGYDNSLRAMPAGVPSSDDYKALLDGAIDASKIDQINAISKSFNTVTTPYTTTAKPDADLQLAINRRFTWGNISVGTITALGYSSSSTNENSFRASYLSSSSSLPERSDTAFSNSQQAYASKVRLSALSNWVLTFSDNQKIEFRNIINNNAVSKTILKQGITSYSGSDNSYERSYELGYESRLTISSQLAGYHKLFGNKVSLDWSVGYSHANKDQPDLRRIKTLSVDSDPETHYAIRLYNNSSLGPFNRFFFKNNEDIYNGSLNYSQKFKFGALNPEVKAGVFLEKKSRDFDSRVFVYSVSARKKEFTLDQNKDAAFSDETFSTISQIFTTTDYTSNVFLRDGSQKSDNYSASNQLLASYIGVNLPITKWFNSYLGVRVEKNKLQLDGYIKGTTTPINTEIDTVDIFPSINSTFKLADDFLFRLSAGKTINRPEFREVSQFSFTNFDDNVTVYGNGNLKNCYVNNYDARFEWYPTSEEIVSFGAFYKHFKDPIELKIDDAGNLQYSYFNAPNAKAYGVEVDVRKRLHEFEKSPSLKFLSNLTFIFNASLIKSVVKMDSSLTRKSERDLQGQSPYLINLGAYYNDAKLRFMTSLMYNKVGKRIAIVGNDGAADIYEMPFNSLDLTLEKGLFKNISVKFGIKNLLDDEVIFQRYQKYEEENTTKVQVTQKQKLGRQFKLGITASF